MLVWLVYNSSTVLVIDTSIWIFMPSCLSKLITIWSLGAVQEAERCFPYHSLALFFKSNMFIATAAHMYTDCQNILLLQLSTFNWWNVLTNGLHYDLNEETSCLSFWWKLRVWHLVGTLRAEYLTMFPSCFLLFFVCLIVCLFCF